MATATMTARQAAHDANILFMATPAYGERGALRGDRRRAKCDRSAACGLYSSEGSTKAIWQGRRVSEDREDITLLHPALRGLMNPSGPSSWRNCAWDAPSARSRRLASSKCWPSFVRTTA